MTAKIQYLLLGLIILLITCQSAIAGGRDYLCKITHVYDLSADGSLKLSNWEKQFKGNEFSVSRRTGKIKGDVLTTLLSNATQVINKGSVEYSFKSLAYFDAANKPLSSGREASQSTVSVQLLEIQEFRKPTAKPFVAMSMGGAGIVTGICK